MVSRVPEPPPKMIPLYSTSCSRACFITLSYRPRLQFKKIVGFNPLPIACRLVTLATHLSVLHIQRRVLRIPLLKCFARTATPVRCSSYLYPMASAYHAQCCLSQGDRSRPNVRTTRHSSQNVAGLISYECDVSRLFGCPPDVICFSPLPHPERPQWLRQ